MIISLNKFKKISNKKSNYIFKTFKIVNKLIFKQE